MGGKGGSSLPHFKKSILFQECKLDFVLLVCLLLLVTVVMLVPIIVCVCVCVWAIQNFKINTKCKFSLSLYIYIFKVKVLYRLQKERERKSREDLKPGNSLFCLNLAIASVVSCQQDAPIPTGIWVFLSFLGKIGLCSQIM